MSILELGQLISTVGFPVAVATWMIWYHTRRWEQLLDRLAKHMDSNTEALRQLQETNRLLAHELGVINAWNGRGGKEG